MASKYNIPDPQKALSEFQKQAGKYKIGETGVAFRDIKDLSPTFAFDFLSLDSSELCFNSAKLTTDDYVGFLNCLKTISSKTYEKLKVIPNYRFHQIDLDDARVTLTRKQFKAILVPREELLDDDQLPTLYQFDLNYTGAARACGFLFKGVFYIIWFDRFHQIYPSNN